MDETQLKGGQLDPACQNHVLVGSSQEDHQNPSLVSGKIGKSYGRNTASAVDEGNDLESAARNTYAKGLRLPNDNSDPLSASKTANDEKH